MNEAQLHLKREKKEIFRLSSLQLNNFIVIWLTRNATQFNTKLKIIKLN